MATRTRGTTSLTQNTTGGRTRLPSRAAARARRRAATRHRVRTQLSLRVRSVAAWFRSTVTPGGWLLLLVSTAGLLGGLIFGWVELVGAGLTSFLLLLFALPFLLRMRNLEASVEITRERVTVGEALAGQLYVRNVGRGISLPGQINLPIGAGTAEIGIPFLRGQGVFSQSLEIPTSRRGVIRVGPPGTTRSSPIGVFERETAWGNPRNVFVYPRTTRIPSTEVGLMRDLEGEPSVRIVNDDLSFHAIREYIPGDTRRHIHWKSTAKTGRLMVRQYEETLRSEMAIVLDTRRDAYTDDEQFELAVSVAATFGLRGLQDGRGLRFVAGSATSSFESSGRAALFNLSTVSRRPMLDDTARLRLSDFEVPLAALTEAVPDASGHISVAVVVTGANTTWREVRSAALKFPADVGVLSVICDGEAKPRIRVAGGITAMTVAVLEDLPGLLSRRSQ